MVGSSCPVWSPYLPETQASQEAAPTVEVYLEAAEAYVLDESGVDDGHWLKRLVEVVSPEQVRVRTGTTLHRDTDPGLADYAVALELVDALHVGLDGHPGNFQNLAKSEPWQTPDNQALRAASGRR